MKNLKMAVVNALGYDDLNDREVVEVMEDIRGYGMINGFSGFIYYADTVKFFDDNKSAIMEIARHEAESRGDSICEMVASFNCLDNNYTIDEVAEAIYSENSEWSTTIKNAMSWFAAEYIARTYA